jgi:hypothetical protein
MPQRGIIALLNVKNFHFGFFFSKKVMKIVIGRKKEKTGEKQI